MLMSYCGLCSGGVHEPLSVVARVAAFTSTGGDLRSTLGRSAWAAVVIGSEWEVPPQLSALRGNVLMSVRCGVAGNGRDDICRVLTECDWLMVRELTLDKREKRRVLTT